VIDSGSGTCRADGFSMEASSSVGVDNIHLSIDFTDGVTPDNQDVTGALKYTKADMASPENFTANLSEIDSGTVHISYFIGNPRDPYELRYVNSSDWSRIYRIAEGNGMSTIPYYGDCSKIAVGVQDKVYILYRNRAQELQLAEFAAADVVNTLRISTIEKAGIVGPGMDIAIDTSRTPNLIHFLLHLLRKNFIF
jgi:hypothetical protein